jgi:hypothetical protein
VVFGKSDDNWAEPQAREIPTRTARSDGPMKRNRTEMSRTGYFYLPRSPEKGRLIGIE